MPSLIDQIMNPVVLVDTREDAPLDLPTLQTQVQGLPVGDYGVKGFSCWQCPAFVVERKSVNDLVGSVTKGRKRFEREIEKLRQFRFRALLIEGAECEVQLGQYRSMANPTSVMSTLDAYAVRCNLHIIWGQDRQRAAEKLENLVRMFVRGVAKDYKRALDAQKTDA